jgi:DNA-binding CsgD family transcriptional regulator
MSTSFAGGDHELRSLAALVNHERDDLPKRGVPLSLLSDLKVQIPCDYVLFHGYDTRRNSHWFAQQVPEEDEDPDSAFYWDFPEFPEFPEFWQHFWTCKPCSYPDTSGDLRSVVQETDFYSVREFHSTGMYCDVMRPQGFEHQIALFLPEPPGPDAGIGRTARLFLLRGPGPAFSERDRSLLTLLRPHLQEAFQDAERRRNPVPDLTPRHWDLLHLLAAGRTNTQIARQLGLSEGTVRTHLENIYARLEVSNRTAAIVRAFPNRVA